MDSGFDNGTGQKNQQPLVILFRRMLLEYRYLCCCVLKFTATNSANLLVRENTPTQSWKHVKWHQFAWICVCTGNKIHGKMINDF